MTNQQIKKRFLVRLAALTVSVGLILAGLVATALPLRAAPEGAPEIAAAPAKAASGSGMKYLASAIAVGLGSVGTGIAVAIVGSAAMASIVERPELFGKILVYLAMAEGVAIFGFLIAYLILGSKG